MKEIVVAIAVAALMITAAAAAQEQGEQKSSTKIQWWTDFDDALKHAKTQGKPLILDFTNPN